MQGVFKRKRWGERGDDDSGGSVFGASELINCSRKVQKYKAREKKYKMGEEEVIRNLKCAIRATLFKLSIDIVFT